MNCQNTIRCASLFSLRGYLSYYAMLYLVNTVRDGEIPSGKSISIPVNLGPCLRRVYNSISILTSAGDTAVHFHPRSQRLKKFLNNSAPLFAFVTTKHTGLPLDKSKEYGTNVHFVSNASNTRCDDNKKCRRSWLERLTVWLPANFVVTNRFSAGQIYKSFLRSRK